MSNDEKAIRALVEEWMAATKRGDIAAVLNMMTEDVIFMVPGMEPFGKGAFAANSAKMQGVTFEGKSEVHEIEVMGDWAYLRNHIEISMTPPGREAMHRSGYTLTILRKSADGQWRISRDANLLTAGK